MSEIRTLPSARALEPARWEGELPPLGTADRVALRLGLALILWGQRHDASHRLAEARAEASRRTRADERAARSRDAAFEHRSHAGPTW
jgi:hypothetical protein